MDVDALQNEYEELAGKLTSPDVLSDGQKLQEYSRRYRELKELLDLSKRIEIISKRIQENKVLIEKHAGEELAHLADEELRKDEEQKNDLEKKLVELLNPAPDLAVNEVIVEIRPGVGGEEAALFAQNLFRMYTRYAELKAWKVTILEENKSELKGMREVIFEISGAGVYSALKNESGVHRVQRTPETEKSGRIHTSTSSVAVLPKAKPIDIEIRSEDLKVETFRSSGPGGQNVNKVATAVRITHLPTGMVVASQTSRSQAQNREIALTILRSRLLKERQEEEDKKIKQERKEQIGGGERSEKIRTYNFPQDRITDHRLNKSWHNLQRILDGDMDIIVEAFKQQ